MRIKKILSFIVTIALVISMIPATAFAANNTATTMRLAKTDGTVTVTNATDKVIKQTDNMKLYNGYQLKTDAESYAWISLDDKKAAKLDANSVVSVQKSGKKLTLYLSSGNLFFNVKETLKSDESFNIKTSTMTMGIRGTSGCVRVINPRVSEVHLMTGTVEVHVEHPELNISKTAVITAGETATSLIDTEALAVSGELVEIVIEKLDEETVCGNCAVEVKADDELQERIEEETDLDVEEIIENAEEKLEADEKAAEEEQKKIEEAVNNQEFPEVVDPYFEEVEESDDSDDNSAAATPVETNVVTSWQELIEKINAFNAGDEDEEIVLGENLPTAEDFEGTLDPLPAVDNADGKTLTLNLSEYILGLDEPLVNNGNLIITNSDGAIGPHSNASENHTVIENYGSLTLENGDIVVYKTGRGVYNKEGALFTMNGGSVLGGEITVDGNNELVYTEGYGNDAGSPLAVYNAADAAVEINGGTVSAYWGVQGEGDVEMNGGIIDINNDGGGFAFDPSGDGTITMTGGTINLYDYAYGVQMSGTTEFTMTGGTINVKGDYAVGINNPGKAVLSGGTINVAAGYTDAIGVDNNMSELVMDGVKVRAYSGIGVRLSGSAEIVSPAKIYAYNDANAVVVVPVSDPLVEENEIVRPITATISAEKYTSADSADTNGVFYPLADDEMIIEAGAENTDGSRMYNLVDNYGKVSDPLTLAEKVQAFNDGTSDETIILDQDVDMTATTETLPSVGTSSSDTKTLTIDLNGKTLTLAESWFNLGNLVVKDSASGGQIIGDADDRLIANSGNLTWESGTLTVTKEATSGIESTGKVIMNGGTIQASDASLQTSNMVAVDITGGTFEMNGGYIQSEVTRTEFPSGYSYYSAIALRNSGTADLNNGIILAETIRTSAVSNSGTLNMKGASVQAIGESSTGVVNAGTVNMYNGEFVAAGESSQAFSMGSNGDWVQFDGGLISANTETAIAYVSNNNTNISSEIITSIRAVNSGRIWTGNLPDGYYIPTEMADGAFYYLTAETALYASDWETFTEAVTTFNSSNVYDTITLAANISNPSEEEVEAFPLANINNVNGNTLTLDLDTYQLALPVILNADTPLEITGTTGSITADDQLLPGATLISGSNIITLSGGTIGVPANYCGIDGNEFEMTGGTVDVTEGTGIQSGNSAVLSGGTINVNAGTGLAVNDGTTVFDGTTINVSGNNGTGVNVSGGYFAMSSGDIVVDSGFGIWNTSTAYLDGGAGVTVNSTGGEEKGIYNIAGGSVTIDGAFTILVNGSTDANKVNYGLYDNGGSVDIVDGIIMVTAGAYDDAGEGNAYALYSAETQWTDFNYTGEALVRASSAENVISPECEGYEAVEDTDGYFYLQEAEDSGNVYSVTTPEELLEAFNMANSTEGLTTINLANDISMANTTDAEGNEVAYSAPELMMGSEATLDLAGNELYLADTMTNSGTLKITDSVSGGSITGSAETLVENSGTLTWDYGNMTVSASGGYGLVNSGGTATVGNGTLNSDTIISLTGNTATGISVDGGSVTADGIQIATSSSSSEVGIAVESGAELTVESATIYVLSGNTGIDNGGTATLNGASLSSNSGNAGTLVKNTGDLTVTDGTMTTDSGAAVDMQSGTFVMSGGTITTTSYYYGALRLIGGETEVTGGNIVVKSNGGGEKGVTVASAATFTLDGGTITATGHSSNASYINYGIYDNGGTVNVLSGEITATSTVGTADENGEIAGGNAYAMYSAGWNAVNIDNNGNTTTAVIRASAYDNVMTDSTSFSLTTSLKDDGYYHLVCEQ